jgi:hypothetical protein
MNPQLLLLAAQNAPQIISLLRDLFVKANPAAPVPTDAEIKAAWSISFVTSLAKDDAILAAHKK